MKRLLNMAAAPAALLFVLTSPALSQTVQNDTGNDGGLIVEARGGYAFPVGNFSDDLGADPDFGFGAGLTLALTPGFGIYGGWARDRFDCDICGSGDELRVSGFEGGVTFMFPDRSGFVPWLKAGLLWHATGVRIAGVTTESDRTLGFQGALGFDVPVGETFSISPSLRYNHVPAELEIFDFDFVNDQFDTDVQYLSIDVGIRVHTRRGP